MFYKMLKQRKIILLVMLAFILIPLLSACGNSQTYPKVSLKAPLVTSTSEAGSSKVKPLRVVLASITSPQESRVYYDNMLSYVGQQLGIPIQIVQRKTYAEANDLLRAGTADVAFVCTYAYVLGNSEFGMKLLAAPEIDHKITYNAYIIVNKDSDITNFSQFKGRTFAFTDPMSNTGTLYPLSLVKSLGYNQDNFFSKYFYTYSHDYAIQAVASKLADGASVDSTVFNYLKEKKSPLIAKVKVIDVSPPYGMPPVVVRPNLDLALQNKLQNVLLQMNKTEEGQKILANLHIEQFVRVNDSNYDSVRDLAREAGENG